MPLFGLPSDSPQDAGQNTQLLALSQRLSLVEADKNTLLSRVSQLEAGYPVAHTHFWGMGNAYNNASQKSWTKSVSGSNEFSRSANVSSAAVNDTVEYQFPLKSGIYQVEVIYVKRTDGGIATFYLDGNQIGQVDTYGSSTTNVNRFTTNVSVANSGLHTFKAVVAGKNSSSTSYVFSASAILISAAPTIFPVNLVLINAGDQQSYVATDGRTWQQDDYFTGGVRTDLEGALGAFTVAGTQNQRIYKFERAQDNASFQYNIPIGSPGIFTLKLLFAENYHTAVGARVGSVLLNGNSLLTNFDILAEVARRTALVKAWTNVTMPTSTVNLTFTNMLINGIELVRTG